MLKKNINNEILVDLGAVYHEMVEQLHVKNAGYETNHQPCNPKASVLALQSSGYLQKR